MTEKFRCISISNGRRGLTLNKDYVGKFSDCGTAFLFVNDNGENDFWTINDYTAFMVRQKL